MEFIGENGWPCPLLKDVTFDGPQIPKKLYRDGLLILYRLFNRFVAFYVPILISYHSYQ